MWKLIIGICLTVCVSATADESSPNPSVFVKCCGRLRDGVAAIGGETTGTTITFAPHIWELDLGDETARAFAKAHHKKPVFVTGNLRIVKGVEKKVRWIVDVESIEKCDPSRSEEGAGLMLRGILRAAKPSQEKPSRMTIATGGHSWPIEFSDDARLQATADSLVDDWVVLTGLLKQVVEKESNVKRNIIDVKTLKQKPPSPSSVRQD